MLHQSARRTIYFTLCTHWIPSYVFSHAFHWTRVEIWAHAWKISHQDLSCYFRSFCIWRGQEEDQPAGRYSNCASPVSVVSRDRCHLSHSAPYVSAIAWAAASWQRTNDERSKHGVGNLAPESNANRSIQQRPHPAKRVAQHKAQREYPPGMLSHQAAKLQTNDHANGHKTLGTGGFPGIHMVGWGGGGVGWGMITFFALAHMVGATQHHGMGWDGVGWGMITFVLTAGDNCAESLCAVSKKQLRRTNLNIAVVRDKIEHRYLLSSHFLNKAPGLARIMQALRCHKMKCMSGLVSPTDAFKKPLWQLWLTCSKKKRLTVMLLGPQIHCK